MADVTLGKDIYACTDIITVKEMTEQLSAVSGKTVKTNGLPVEVFKSEDFQKKVGQELWDNMDLFYRRWAPHNLHNLIIGQNADKLYL